MFKFQRSNEYFLVYFRHVVYLTFKLHWASIFYLLTLTTLAAGQEDRTVSGSNKKLGSVSLGPQVSLGILLAEDSTPPSVFLLASKEFLLLINFFRPHFMRVLSKFIKATIRSSKMSKHSLSLVKRYLEDGYLEIGDVLLSS